jgi:16S rRNA (cytidine1402-2'-O)-methyltransferase
VKIKPLPAGCLYVVATPIGNPEDITLRALTVLSAVDVVAAEDTRRAGLLLAAHKIKKPLLSCYEHNEQRRAEQLVNKLCDGLSVALISDAGTPLLSDPGFRLITAALDHGIPVVPVPGVSAATAALSVAGLPTDSFVFVGFAAKKAAKRRQQLDSLAREPRTLLFFVSARDLPDLLADILESMGNRKAVLAREMTKAHEEFWRCDVGAMIEKLKDRPALKGECTLVLAGAPEPEADQIPAAALKALKAVLADPDGSLADGVRQVAARFGLSRRAVYRLAVCLKNHAPGAAKTQRATFPARHSD